MDIMKEAFRLILNEADENLLFLDEIYSKKPIEELEVYLRITWIKSKNG